MLKNALIGIAILGLTAAWAAGGRADFPVKVNCNVQFNVKFGNAANGADANKAPWYSYFPVDPQGRQAAAQQQAAVGTRFPNWPWLPPTCDATGIEVSQSRYPSWPAITLPTPPTPPERRTSADGNSGAGGNIILTSGVMPVWRPVSYTPPQPAGWPPVYYAAPPNYYYYGR